MLLMLHCIFWLEMEYPAKCKCSYKFLQERVLTHDAADSAKLADIVRIIIFLYCILYCIVLMVLFLQSWCVLWLNCCRIYYSLHFVSDQCTRHLFVMYTVALLCLFILDVPSNSHRIRASVMFYLNSSVTWCFFLPFCYRYLCIFYVSCIQHDAS